MTKLRVILAAFALLGGSFAFSNYLLWAENPQPTSLSFEAYLRDRPRARWLRLTECHVDTARPIRLSVTEAGSSRRYADEVYHAVYRDEKREQPVRVLVRDFGYRRQGDAALYPTEDLPAWGPDEPGSSEMPTDRVHGLAIALEDADSETRGALAGVEEIELAPDCVVLQFVEWPEKEDWTVPGSFAGIAALGLGATFLRRRRPAPGVA